MYRRKPVVASLATLLVTLLLVPGVAGQEVVRGHDLGGLLTPAREIDSWLTLPEGPVLPGDSDEEYSTDGGLLFTQPARPPSVDQSIVERWLEVLAPEAAAEARFTGGRLVLSATPETHSRIEELIEFLLGVARQPLTLSVYRIPAGAEADAQAVLDARGVGVLLDAVRPRQSLRTTIHADWPSLIENGTAHSIVHDYDAEVAQEASIADPKCDVFFLGERLGVVATPLADGRLSLRLGLAHSSALREPEHRTFRRAELGVLQLPDVEFARAQVSAIVEDGGGVIVRGDADAWLVRIQRARQASLRLGALVTIPLGAHALNPFVVERPFDPIHRPGEGDFGLGRSEKKLTKLAYVFDGLVPDATPEGQVTFVGTHACFVGDEATQGRLRRALVADLERTRTWSVAWRLGSVARSALAGAGGEAEVERIVAALESGGRIATSTGEPFAVAAGGERAIVADFDVRIASGATCPNPIVRTLTTGWFLTGRIVRGAGGAPVLDGELVRAHSDSVRTTDLGAEQLGAVDLPSTTFTTIRSRESLVPGRWQIVDVRDDHDDPDGRVLVFAVRVE